MHLCIDCAVYGCHADARLASTPSATRSDKCEDRYNPREDCDMEPQRRKRIPELHRDPSPHYKRWHSQHQVPTTELRKGSHGCCPIGMEVLVENNRYWDC